MSIIDIQNVTKIFERSHLGRTKKSIGVEDLTLSINKGEVFGLLGLNGAGKTTTIKLLLGLLFPNRGSVRVLNYDMPDQAPLKKIGYLPEAAYINRYLSGYEAVTLFARLSGIPKSERDKRVEDMIKKVGMTKSADRRVSEYSKGMTQRISIAQALIHDPEIIIMDEPITGLDPLAIQEVRELIIWLKDQGKTVFFSSHNISEVEKVCDRIAILTNGKLASVLEQKSWKGKEGELEKIFVSTANRTESIGALSFK